MLLEKGNQKMQTLVNIIVIMLLAGFITAVIMVVINFYSYKWEMENKRGTVYQFKELEDDRLYGLEDIDIENELEAIKKAFDRELLTIDNEDLIDQYTIIEYMYLECKKEIDKRKIDIENISK